MSLISEYDEQKASGLALGKGACCVALSSVFFLRSFAASLSSFVLFSFCFHVTAVLCVDISMLIAAVPSPVIAGHKHTPVEIHILINNMCVSTQPQTPGKDNNYPDKECLVLISVCISTTTAMSAPPGPCGDWVTRGTAGETRKNLLSGHMTYERERKQQAPKMKAWHGIDDEWVKHNNNNKRKKERKRPFQVGMGRGMGRIIPSMLTYNGFGTPGKISPGSNKP